MNLNNHITEDHKLLTLMVEDQDKAEPIFRPGGYWRTKTKNSTKRILNAKLSDFRTGESLIGLSYADNLSLDASKQILPGWKTRLFRLMRNIPPIGYVVDSQVDLTRLYYQEMLAMK